MPALVLLVLLVLLAAAAAVLFGAMGWKLLVDVDPGWIWRRTDGSHSAVWERWAAAQEDWTEECTGTDGVACISESQGLA